MSVSDGSADVAEARAAGLHTIGEAAAQAGVSVKMVRYYESIGLIPPAARSQGGYRLYAADDVHALRFIRRARDLGFAIDEIRHLLALWRDQERASAEVKRLAEAHIRDLDARIAGLQGMRDALQNLVQHCHGDARPDCPILDELADKAPGKD